MKKNPEVFYGTQTARTDRPSVSEVYNPAFEAEIVKAKDKCYRYNRLNPNDRESQRKILTALFGKTGKECIVTPPFWCDYGYNIEVGDFFYSNHNF